MSHICNFSAVEIKTLADLKNACTSLGYTFVEGQTTYEWYGRFMGDAQLPPGVQVKDLGKCVHAIKVPGAKYEVGVVKVGDHYELRYDYWRAGGLSQDIGNRISQRYASEAVKRSARLSGKRLLKQTEQTDGSIKLVLAVR